MSRFSERIRGGAEAKVLQLDDMNEELRASLWNVAYLLIFKHVNRYGPLSNNKHPDEFYSEFLALFLKKPVDEVNRIGYSTIKDFFLTKSWDEVYDLVEFTSQWCGDGKALQREFQELVNIVLLRENSGYRFVGGWISPVVTDYEVDEIEAAIAVTDKFSSVRYHLKIALQLMSDRNSRDYRNSIKESICAVESLVKTVTGDEKGTLGKLIKILGRDKDLPPTIIKAYDALYGYTSSEDGIRHAMLDMDESSLKYTDARYMLIVCSAFVNYVIESDALQR